MKYGITMFATDVSIDVVELAPQVVDHDPRSLGRQLQGVRSPEPAPRSGDDDDASLADPGHGPDHGRI